MANIHLQVHITGLTNWVYKCGFTTYILWYRKKMNNYKITGKLREFVLRLFPITSISNCLIPRRESIDLRNCVNSNKCTGWYVISIPNDKLNATWYSIYKALSSNSLFEVWYIWLNFNWSKITIHSHVFVALYKTHIIFHSVVCHIRSWLFIHKKCEIIIIYHLLRDLYFVK